MLPKSAKSCHCGLILGCCLLGVFVISPSYGNSIMDIIDMEKVEKFIAEKKWNGSAVVRERKLLLHNSVDSEESFFPGIDYGDEGGTKDEASESESEPRTPKKHGMQGSRRGKYPLNQIFGYEKGKTHRNLRHNLTGIPDFSSVFADLTGARADKVLRSEDNSALITKKEYLKKDWCKTEPMILKIREEGCLTRTVLNRFCYGQCNSFYIPKDEPKRKKNARKWPMRSYTETEEHLTFRSCGFCKPKKAAWVTVTLRCPSMLPPHFKKKKVQRIKQCKCIAENFNP